MLKIWMEWLHWKFMNKRQNVNVKKVIQLHSEYTFVLLWLLIVDYWRGMWAISTSHDPLVFLWKNILSDVWWKLACKKSVEKTVKANTQLRIVCHETIQKVNQILKWKTLQTLITEQKVLLTPSQRSSLDNTVLLFSN